MVKGGTGGKNINVKDKIYMERKRSNNAAEIVRKADEGRNDQSASRPYLAVFRKYSLETV